MLATNNPTLSHAPRSFANPDPELDRHVLAGALSALSALAVQWLRRNGVPPSQGHWEAVELAQVDGEVSRAR
ncbi:MAG: hypothetical protein KA978_24785 [Deltaproteobacteria bacterium]|jgi:hypothetical protein|nr:hypothetical protein [Deltaproteobacteria bacterium]